MDKVVHEDTDPTRRTRCKLCKDILEHIDTAQDLNDDPLVPQIIAPNLLDEFSIMEPLNEQPARLRDPGSRGWGGDRPGSRLGRWCLPGDGQINRFTIQQEPVRERKRSNKPIEISQLKDSARAKPKHLSYKFGQGMFKDETTFEFDNPTTSVPFRFRKLGNRITVITINQDTPPFSNEPPAHIDYPGDNQQRQTSHLRRPVATQTQPSVRPSVVWQLCVANRRANDCRRSRYAYL